MGAIQTLVSAGTITGGIRFARSILRPPRLQLGVESSDSVNSAAGKNSKLFLVGSFLDLYHVICFLELSYMFIKPHVFCAYV